MPQLLALLIIVPTAIALAACVLYVLGALGMGAAAGIDGLVTSVRNHIRATGRPGATRFGTPALHH